jgi:hypothetical protein
MSSTHKKKNKKIFQKPLDKSKILCYNKNKERARALGDPQSLINPNVNLFPLISNRYVFPSSY